VGGDSRITRESPPFFVLGRDAHDDVGSATPARARRGHAHAMSRVPEVVYNLWVRMWRERDAEMGSWEWRGRVKDAVTHQDRPFRRMEGLIDAIEEMTGEPAEGSPEGSNEDSSDSSN
jgi:hypothetical protein